MRRLTINQLSYLSNLPEQTILYWHKKMNIFPDILPTKDVNFKYNTTHLNRLLNVATLFHFDKKYTLEDLTILTDAELDLKVNIELMSNLISKKYNDDIINQLIASCMVYDEDRFNLIMNSSIKKLSQDDFFENVLYPLIRRIYESLYDEVEKPVQFFYIENLLKRKVYSIIDHSVFPIQRQSKFILFLSQDECSEIGLLFCYLIMLHKGFKTIYIGTNQNSTLIKQAIDDLQPDAIFTFVSSPKNLKPFNELINELDDYSEKLFVIGNEKSLKPFKNNSIKKIHDITEFQQELEHLETKKTDS